MTGAVPPTGDRPAAPRDPVWRQDFPLTAAGEDEVTRREFVRYLVLASGGFAVGATALMAHLWFSGQAAFAFGGFALRLWLFVSAVVCVWIARIALDGKKSP